VAKLPGQTDQTVIGYSDFMASDFKPAI